MRCITSLAHSVEQQAAASATHGEELVAAREQAAREVATVRSEAEASSERERVLKQELQQLREVCFAAEIDFTLCCLTP